MPIIYSFICWVILYLYRFKLNVLSKSGTPLEKSFSRCLDKARALLEADEALEDKEAKAAMLDALEAAGDADLEAALKSRVAEAVSEHEAGLISWQESRLREWSRDRQEALGRKEGGAQTKWLCSPWTIESGPAQLMRMRMHGLCSKLLLRYIQADQVLLNAFD